jgi:hypothetical protein
MDYFTKKAYNKIAMMEHQKDILEDMDEGDDPILSDLLRKRNNSKRIVFSRTDTRINFEWGKTDLIKSVKDLVDSESNGFSVDSFYIAGISDDFKEFGVYTSYNDYVFSPLFKFIIDYISSSSNELLGKQFMHLSATTT